MVILRDLVPEDAPALQRVYRGASVRYTTGRALTLGEAHDRIRAALAGATERPRRQWTWAIVIDGELIGRIALRRRTPVMGSLSYILREDTWGHGHATEAARRVARFAFTATVTGQMVKLTEYDAYLWAGDTQQGRVSRAVKAILGPWCKRTVCPLPRAGPRLHCLRAAAGAVCCVDWRPGWAYLLLALPPCPLLLTPASLRFSALPGPTASGSRSGCKPSTGCEAVKLCGPGR
ncbi:GNAT family N-acetyltransferase [Streptomyces sp. NPDC003077]|uniref:GNAT family N-acetyltransferase n=1 Tax=Streptomyces sp. NPDC003077 TaxID=3154443 RepID=UPI0033BDE852